MNAILEPKQTINGVTEKIHCIIQEVYEKCISCSAHYHTYIELIYCLNGEFSAWLNGKNYYFTKGDLLVISSNEVHEIYALSDSPSSYIVIKFEPEILYNSLLDTFDTKYVFPFTLDNTAPQKVFSYSEIYSTELPKLIHNILDEYSKKEYGFELAVKADICRIFLWILRHWNDMGITIPHTDSLYHEHIKSIQKVLEYLAEHYSEDVTAEDMAKLANLSYSYFSRVFKQIMNRSFNDYLNFIRITEAEKLLISTDKNITEIAVETGFSSSSYFIKVFDKYKKISPSQFRKNFNI